MAAPALLTPEEFAAGTGGRVSASDPRLPALLAGATRAIRRYAGWHIAPVISESDVLLDSNGGSLAVLPTLRLLSVDALATRDRGAQWHEYDAAELTDLEWSENGELRRCWWPRRFRSIRISFTHGFEDAPDVKQIVQQVVANGLSSPMGATQESAGALSVSWSSTAPGVSGGISLLARDFAVLDLYALPERT